MTVTSGWFHCLFWPTSFLSLVLVFSPNPLRGWSGCVGAQLLAGANPPQSFKLFDFLWFNINFSSSFLSNILLGLPYPAAAFLLDTKTKRLLPDVIKTILNFTNPDLDLWSFSFVFWLSFNMTKETLAFSFYSSVMNRFTPLPGLSCVAFFTHS